MFQGAYHSCIVKGAAPEQTPHYNAASDLGPHLLNIDVCWYSTVLLQRCVVPEQTPSYKAASVLVLLFFKFRIESILVANILFDMGDLCIEAQVSVITAVCTYTPLK